VTSDQVNRVIQDLNPSKSVSGALPLKVIKMVADIVSGPIATCLNISLNSGIFPQNLLLQFSKKVTSFLRRIIDLNQLSSYFDNILNFQLV